MAPDASATSSSEAPEAVDPTLIRVVSSSVGSILTAFVVTPLDVVKVRQQASSASPFAQSAMSACSRCGSFVLNTGLIHGECIIPKVKSPHFHECVPNPAAAAAALGQPGGQPAAARPMAPPFPSTTARGLAHIWRREGLAGIYSGLTPTLVMAVPATVLYFTAYDSLKLSIGAAWPAEAPGRDWAAAPLAGVAARVLASAVTSPLELVRTIMQAGTSSSSSSSSNSGGTGIGGGGGGGSSMAGSFRSLVARGGIASLWRGLEPTLWRDVPFSAIYWLALEQAKQRIDAALLADRLRSDPVRTQAAASAAAQHPSHPHPQHPQHPQREESVLAHGLRSFGAGAFAGVLAAAAQHPSHPHPQHPQHPQREESVLAHGLRSFGAGAFAGMLAAAATTPMDVVKTRRQVFSTLDPALGPPLGPPISLEANVVGTASAGSAAGSAAAGNGSTPAVVRAILREAGVGGLFRGLGARVLKIAPACAIMISSYDAGKRAFGLDA